MTGRDAAGGARAELAHTVGLDQRQKLRPVGGKQRDEEARALAEAHVGLEARDPELEIGRGQDMKQALGQADSEARAVLDHTLRQAREAALHRLDGVLGCQELLDVGFAEIEGHGAG